MAEGKAERYRVLEPTFEVEGGTPVDALEHVLNQHAVDGYRLVGSVPVRGAKDGQAESQWVHAIVLEKES